MRRDIVVVGASAGGVEAFKRFVVQLAPRMSATFCLVLHMPRSGGSLLPGILSDLSPLPLIVPQDGERFRQGAIYLPTPDHHLALERDALRVFKGPMQHRHRPSIDVLFRSAAEALGPRVVGVVLTGLLDDGAAGLLAIKQHGGVGVVQDPSDAEYPDMPRNAMRAAAVDHCEPLAQIPRLLQKLTREGEDQDEGDGPQPMRGRGGRTLEWSRGGMSKAAEETRAGDALAAGSASTIDERSRPSAYTCPDCHGVLWEVPDPTVAQFVCRTGHAYSMESLGAEQDVAVEDALWAAVRALSERASMARQMAETWRKREADGLARELDEKAERCQRQAARIRELLTSE